MEINLKALPSRSSRRVIQANEVTECYWQFKRSRTRVETLDSYSVPGDDRMYAAFLAGDTNSQPDREWLDWFARNRKTVDEGARLLRIHVVPRILTSYLKYEIEFVYAQYNAPSGEEIRIVFEDSVPRLAVLPKHDFYLFDDSSVLVVCYSPEGKVLSWEFETDSHAISWHRAHIEDLMTHSISLKAYLAGEQSL